LWIARLSKTYHVIEKEILESYLEKINSSLNQSSNSKDPNSTADDLKNLNLAGLSEDIGLVAFALAVNKAGSEYFWVKIFDFVKLAKDSLSPSALENYLFCCYRSLNNQQSQTLPSKIQTVLSEFEDIITKKELLKNNIINPFNTSMPYAKLGRFPEELFNYIAKNIYEVISNTKFQAHPYVMGDLIFIFGTYKTYLDSLSELDKAGKQYFYLLNYKKFWMIIDDLFSRTENYSSFILSNIVLA